MSDEEAIHPCGNRFVDDEGRCLQCCRTVSEARIAALEKELAIEKEEVASWKINYEAASAHRDVLEIQYKEATQRLKAWRECAGELALALRKQPLSGTWKDYYEAALATFDALAKEEPK